MKVPRCKGMRDLLPDDMAKFRQIEEVFRHCSTKWGYEEVRTPMLEYLHLFTATGTLTAGMLGRVYSFLDWDGWSGERVVLRPEGTIPAARLYLEDFAGDEIIPGFPMWEIPLPLKKREGSRGSAGSAVLSSSEKAGPSLMWSLCF